MGLSDIALFIHVLQAEMCVLCPDYLIQYHSNLLEMSFTGYIQHIFRHLTTGNTSSYYISTFKTTVLVYLVCTAF